MGCCQARAPIEGAVKLGSTEPTIKASPQNTKLAIETNKEFIVNHDANTIHDDRPEVQADLPTNKVQTNKVAPDSIEKSNAKKPASFRDNEDSKSTPDNNTAVQQKHSSPQLNNKNKSDRFEDHGIGQIHKPQNGKTDKVELEVVKQPPPVKQTEKPIDISFEKELDNHNDKDFKKQSMKELSNSNNKSIDKMNDHGEHATDLNKSNHKVPELDLHHHKNNHMKAPIFEEEKFKSSRNDERGQKNLEFNNSKSITSENKHAKDADNYVGGLMDKIIGNNSNVMQSNKASNEDEDEEDEKEGTINATKSPSKQADMINHNTSVEKRICDTSECSDSSKHILDFNEEENKEHSHLDLSGSSTAKNAANNYVSNLMKGFY